MGPVSLRRPVAFCAILLYHFFVHTPESGAQLTDRGFEPVVVTGSEFPDFANADISHNGGDLFLFAFRGGTWMQIPFQFDERDGSGNYFGSETEALLDGNDELVFMTKDAGDRNDNSWIDDLTSQNWVRYEITVNDDVNQTASYVYLYRSTSLGLDAQLTDYVTYLPPTSGNKAEDGIKTPFYELAHGVNGLAMDLKITGAGGGSNQDILDRVKMRAKARLLITVDVNENNLIFGSSDKVDVKDGLVRVIRKMDATLKKSIRFFPDLNANFVTPPAFYYPFSSEVRLEVPSVSDATILSGRLSMDFNSTASGMKFVSANNPAPGFAIDGSNDLPEKAINPLLPNGNWMYRSGPQGTVVNFFPLEVNVGGSRELYYKDNASNDGGDTGDKKSYGDVGVSIANTINTPFQMGYTTVYLPKDESPDIGSKLAQFRQSPLRIETAPQDFGTVPVELVAFTAAVDGRDIRLAWQTATETNNFGFEVQSRSGQTDWLKIGFVAGQGTTTEPKSYDFLDRNLAPGSYDYRLRQIDTDGSFEYSPIVAATVGAPESFVLHQNYPNPFNPETTIQFEVPGRDNETPTALDVYNILGGHVRTLLNEVRPAGTHSVVWDGRNESGRRLATGLYIYRLRSGSFVSTRKMLLVN